MPTNKRPCPYSQTFSWTLSQSNWSVSDLSALLVLLEFQVSTEQEEGLLFLALALLCVCELVHQGHNHLTALQNHRDHQDYGTQRT